MKVVCCGNISFDFILTSENKPSEFTFKARPGGSVFNTGLLLSRLGIDVTILAKTGRDFLSESLVKMLRREKLDTRHILRDRALTTSIAVARIDKKGDSSYIFYRDAVKESSFKKDLVRRDIFKTAKVFHTGSTYSYSDYSFENTLELMRMAKSKKVFITYDPNWRSSRIKNRTKTRARIKKLLRYVDLLKLSASDALSLTGAKTLSGALGKLPAPAAVTLGERGSFLWDGRKRIFQPAFKVRVVDTIGAGDAFTAGLIAGYCARGSRAFTDGARETLAFASKVSALVCKTRGAFADLKLDVGHL